MGKAKATEGGLVSFQLLQLLLIVTGIALLLSVQAHGGRMDAFSAVFG